jgi:hypothetical protein
MKDESDIENKAAFPPLNKGGRQVKVKIRSGRAVAGLGGPGDVVTISPQEAERLVRDGYADKVQE